MLIMGLKLCVSHTFGFSFTLVKHLCCVVSSVGGGPVADSDAPWPYAIRATVVSPRAVGHACICARLPLPLTCHVRLA